MSTPDYVSDENVLFNGTTTQSIVFVDGPLKLLIRWDHLDVRMRADVDYFIEQNGGEDSLPWVAEDFIAFAIATKLPSNGSSFYDMYKFLVRAVDIRPIRVPQQLEAERGLYYDGSEWKDSNTDQPPGSVSAPPIISTESPFIGGGFSYQLSGVVGDPLPVFTGGAAFVPGTGDFTIEWFQYFTGTHMFPRPFSLTHNGSEMTLGCSIEGNDGGRTLYVWNGSATGFSNSISIENAWIHFAIVRESGVLSVYQDGVLIDSSPDVTNINETHQTLYIGAIVPTDLDPQEYFAGYITNLRWTIGLAVYTGNFTVPSTVLTSTAGANPYGGANTAAIGPGVVKLLAIAE